MRVQNKNPLDSNVRQLEFSQLKVEWDVETRTFWIRMRPTPRPCFTPELLDDLGRLPATVFPPAIHGVSRYMRYSRLTSRVSSIWAEI